MFKYVQDCSGGRGDQFLPRIVLIGIEIISSRYFVFCSCFQGAAPAAPSSDRMDELCFALSSLCDLCVLLLGLRENPNDRACEPAWSCQAAWGGWDQYFPEGNSVQVLSEIQTLVRLQVLRPSDPSSEGKSVLHRDINCLYLLHRVTEMPLEDLTWWSHSFNSLFRNWRLLKIQQQYFLCICSFHYVYLEPMWFARVQLIAFPLIFSLT